jgi:rhodanese-related sulfurtransferase
MGIFSTIRNALFGEPVDYAAVLENGGQLIDVRTPAEFRAGHAKGSKNIPSQSFSATQIKKLKGKEVILVCQTGARAAQVKYKLQNQGIKSYNAGSWRSIK